MAEIIFRNHHKGAKLVPAYFKAFREVYPLTEPKVKTVKKPMFQTWTVKIPEHYYKQTQKGCTMVRVLPGDEWPVDSSVEMEKDPDASMDKVFMPDVSMYGDEDVTQGAISNTSSLPNLSNQWEWNGELPSSDDVPPKLYAVDGAERRYQIVDAGEHSDCTDGGDSLAVTPASTPSSTPITRSVGMQYMFQLCPMLNLPQGSFIFPIICIVSYNANCFIFFFFVYVTSYTFMP